MVIVYLLDNQVTWNLAYMPNLIYNGLFSCKWETIELPKYCNFAKTKFWNLEATIPPHDKYQGQSWHNLAGLQYTLQC